MENLIYSGVGLLIGIIICYLALKPKLTKIIEINQDNINKNEQIKKEITEWENQVKQLTENAINLQNEVNSKQIAKSNLEVEIKTKQENAKTIYDQQLNLLKEKIDRQAEAMGTKYQEAEEDAKKEYLKVLEDLSETCASARSTAKNLEIKLKELKAKHDAATEEYKRAQEMAQKKNFYRVCLNEIDIEEIKKLREVEPYLRDPRPLNKVIWSVYYEHPYTDLIGRVVGKGRHTGIYKLTNLNNGMVYVGQAANFADRWKQHIKCAIGAENASNNKLYPAMKEAGPENFTFEIIEECLPEELNEREQYWQDFYKAKEFGYSVR